MTGSFRLSHPLVWCYRGLVVERQVPAAGVVSPFDKLEDGRASFDRRRTAAGRASRKNSGRGRCRTPEPIEGRTSASRQRRPKASEVHWLEMRPSVGYMRVRRRDGCWRGLRATSIAWAYDRVTVTDCQGPPFRTQPRLRQGCRRHAVVPDEFSSLDHGVSAQPYREDPWSMSSLRNQVDTADPILRESHTGLGQLCS